MYVYLSVWNIGGFFFVIFKGPDLQKNFVPLFSRPLPFSKNPILFGGGGILISSELVAPFLKSA